MEPAREESSVHRIRLKGPWDAAFVDSATGVTGEWRRFQVPVAWRDLWGERAGTVRLRRRFHRPSGLEPGDRVMIRIPDGAGVAGEFSINSHTVSADSEEHGLYDVSPYLIAFNEIQFTFTSDPERDPELPGGLWAAAVIEIRQAHS